MTITLIYCPCCVAEDLVLRFGGQLPLNFVLSLLNLEVFSVAFLLCCICYELLRATF